MTLQHTQRRSRRDAFLLLLLLMLLRFSFTFALSFLLFLPLFRGLLVSVLLQVTSNILHLSYPREWRNIHLNQATHRTSYIQHPLDPHWIQSEPSQVKVTDALHNFFFLPDSWVKRTIFASLMVANGSRPSNTCPFGHGSEISERQEKERERKGKGERGNSVSNKHRQSSSLYGRDNVNPLPPPASFAVACITCITS